MRMERDYSGSSGTRAPSSWRGACIPSTFWKTSRAGKSGRSGDDSPHVILHRAIALQRRRRIDPMKNRMAIWATPVLTIALLTMAACTMKTSAEIPQPPPDVEVATVEQRDVPIYHEWIGTLDGMVNAAIKAQVSGYLLSQDYKEGSFVRKGELLFQIDPRPFDAALAQAQGQLAQAKGQLAPAKAQLTQAQAQLAQSAANQERTQLDVDKYTPLEKQHAVTRHELDNAAKNNLAANAQVEASKAAVETARAQIEASSAAVESAQAAVE